MRADQQRPAAETVDEARGGQRERKPEGREHGRHVRRADRSAGRYRARRVGHQAADAAGPLRETRAGHQEQRQPVTVVGEQFPVRARFVHVLLHAPGQRDERLVTRVVRVPVVPLERPPRLIRPPFGQQVHR